jgi:hypothetical protein
VTGPEEVPVVDGPDPRTWERHAQIHTAALDVRAADAMLELLQGKQPLRSMSRAYVEAVDLLERTVDEAREVLAAALLEAHGVSLPEEPEQATEAVGGFRGDGSGPGDRDHV